MMESRQVKEWQDQARGEGRQEGRQESRVEDLLDYIEAKFGQVPSDVPAHLRKIDDANVLRQLLRQAYRAADLDEIRRMIPNGAK